MYGYLAAAILLLAAVGEFSDRQAFAALVGPVDPLLAAAGLLLLGRLLLSYLDLRRGLVVYARPRLRSLAVAAGLALLFGALAIGIDLTLAEVRAIHPRSMNVPWPNSLWFYPLAAFGAEVMFHLLPLALLFGAAHVLRGGQRNANGAGSRDGRPGTPRRPDLSAGYILLVALIEPAFQLSLSLRGVALIGQAPPYTLVALGIDGLLILLFNVVQLRLYARYNFLAMLAMRIAYYLVWHVGWGTIRLGLGSLWVQ